MILILSFRFGILLEIKNGKGCTKQIPFNIISHHLSSCSISTKPVLTLQPLVFSVWKCHLLIPDHIHNIKSFLIKTTKNILQLGFKRLVALPDSNWNKTISSHPTWILYLRNLVQWLQPFGKKKTEMFQFWKVLKIQRDNPRLSRRGETAEYEREFDGMVHRCYSSLQRRLKVIYLHCKPITFVKLSNTLPEYVCIIILTARQIKKTWSIQYCFLN